MFSRRLLICASQVPNRWSSPHQRLSKTWCIKRISSLSVMESDKELIRLLNQNIEPIGINGNYDSLLSSIGDAEIVLIGEASHGTDEFYRSRAEITKRLIKEKGFTVIGIEGDWPNVYQVHRYIQGRAGNNIDIDDLLKRNFKRFPIWMWANTVIRDFAEWLRDYNQGLPSDGKPICFYGLDLYSLYSSVDAVIDYLKTVDPKAAETARKRYECLEAGRDDDESAFHISESCRQKVIRQLVDLQKRAYEFLQQDGRVGEDEYFSALQNAQLVKDSEAYYRSQLDANVSSWNLRDTHMFNTLLATKKFKDQQYQTPAKIVVWAHNSHVGNAKATEAARGGELNIGQLAKEHFGDRAYNIGYSTNSGTVTAASYWGAKAEQKSVKPGMPGSYENLFHQLEQPDFLLLLKNTEMNRYFNGRYLERAIGVVYRPQTERYSHYFYADLPRQFDAMLHFDETRALEPLSTVSKTPKGELPETYPFGE